MRRIVLAFSAAALAAPQPAAAQFSVGADWAERPTPEELAPGYPELAQHLALEGVVRLRCEVAPTGVLTDCRVAHESPKGMGFGPAALKMSATFKMRPPLQPGARHPDTTVQIPITFRLPPTPPAPAAPPLDAQKKQLLDQFADEADPALAWLAQVRQSAELLKTARDPGVDEETAAAAVDASVAAAERLAPQMRRDYLAVAGAELTVEELTELVAFARTPAGKRYLTHNPQRVKGFEALRAETGRRQRFEAHAALCARLACDQKPKDDDVEPMEPDPELVILQWSRRPSPAEERAAWPFASIFGVSLAGILTCTVGAQGAPEDCQVLVAYPEPLGAARAALTLAEIHRVPPEALTSGAAGRRTVLTIFVWGDQPPEPKPFVPKAPKARLELARQVLDAQTGGEPPPSFKSEDLEKAFGSLDPPIRAAAEAALQEGYRRALDTYRVGWTDLLAGEFTEPELRQILAFHRGPGAALRRIQTQRKAQIDAFAKAYSGQVADQAREIFCAKRDCMAAPPPPEPKPQTTAAKPEPSTRKP